MGHRSIRKTVTLGLAGILAVSLAAPVNAAEVNVTSAVTTKYRAARKSFSGRITSDVVGGVPAGVCVKSRRVQLMKVTKRGAKKIKSSRTDQTGRYRIRVRRAKGRYYVKTPKTTNATYGDLIVCSAAKSKTVRVGRR